MSYSAGINEEIYEQNKQMSIKTHNNPLTLQNTLPNSQSSSSENIAMDMDNFENRNFSSYRENENDFMPYTGNHFNFDILPYEKEVKTDDRFYNGAFNWNFDDYFSILN